MANILVATLRKRIIPVSRLSALHYPNFGVQPKGKIFNFVVREGNSYYAGQQNSVVQETDAIYPISFIAENLEPLSVSIEFDLCVYSRSKRLLKSKFSGYFCGGGLKLYYES